MRILLLLATMAVACGKLYGLAGRVEAPKKVVVLEATQQEKRTLAFLEFFQLQSNEEFAFFQNLAPSLMAGELRRHKRIDLPEGDMVPVYPKTLPYELKSIPIDEADYEANTRDLLEEIDGHIEAEEVAYVLTNRLKKELVYHIKKKGVEVVDAHLDPDLSVFTNQEDYLVHTNEDGVRWFVKKRSEQRAPLVVDGKLYSPSSMAFDDLLRGIEADYIVYGTYEPDGKGNLTLNLFFIYKQTQKVYWVGEERISLGRLQEGLVRVGTKLMGFIQKKPMLSSALKVGSSPEGAYLYLNGVYVGRTPLVLKGLLEGDYRYRVWAPKSTLSKVKDSASEEVSLPPENAEGEVEGEEKTFSLTEESIKNRRIDFEFDTQESRGWLSIALRGDAWADFYVNTTLAGAQTNGISTNLNPGRYFLRVSREAYKERWLQVEVYENIQTAIMMDFEPQQKTFWNDIVWDHDRNTKLWGSLGFACLGLYFYVTISRRTLEDASAPYNASLYSGSEAYFDELRTRAAAYDKWNNRFFYGSIFSFTMTMVSRILTIRSSQVPLETMNNSNADVDIKFINKGF